MAKSSVKLQELYADLKAFILALGDDVQVKTLKYYIAFKRLRDFACVEAYPQAEKLALYVSLDPSNLAYEKGFTRNVSTVGHFGTGGVEITIKSRDDLEKAKPLIMRAYKGVG